MKNLTIIAEVGSVHDGSFGNAQKLIEAAARCGADVAKFQTHIAEAETLADAPNPPYFSEEPRMDYFRRTGFSREQWKQLRDLCRKNNVDFLSSPFSLEAVDLLEELEVSAYKIPSGEVTNIPLLHKIAETNKAIYLSSGMSSWRELDTAVEALRRGKGDITVFQCSSAYPCPPEKVGLNVIPEMKARYGVAVGFSDHTLGSAAAIAAVTMGATIVEKHFTFSKLMYGSDAKHSMEPAEFKRFCEDLRETARMVSAPVDKADTSDYAAMKQIFEKSIVSRVAIPPGTIIKAEHLSYKKPGTGISASQYESVIGRKTRSHIPQEKLIRLEDLE